LRAAIAIGAFLSLAASAIAQAPQPFVRARCDPADHIVVGQPVRVIVEVLVPNYFTGVANFPEFEIKNAIVVAPQETPQNFSEQVNGSSFAGIRQTYMVYPETAGDFRLPPAPVGVTYADSPPHSAQANVTLPPLAFHASVPKGATGLSYFLPTTKAVLTQEWKPRLKGLRTGETVERTITITMDKLQGMLIPPLALDAPDGIRLYREQPVVQDVKTDRGEFVGGQRVETARYLIQKPGQYTLPAIELKWWDLNAGVVRAETLPSVQFTAVANPNLSPELPPAAAAVPVAEPIARNPWKRVEIWLRGAWPWIAGAFVLLFLAARIIPRWIRWARKRRAEACESESAFFRKLLSSCRKNDAPNSYRGLMLWLSRKRPGVALEEYLAEAGDPALAKLVAELGASVYSQGGTGAWSGAALADSLNRQRNSGRLAARSVQRLPALNPVVVPSANQRT
jgi:hypothetical protein